MNILIYTGEGTGQAPVRHVQVMATKLLGHRHDIKKVNHEVLINEPWMDSTALLIIPGGRDLPYTTHLNGKANQKIRQYVENGGKYLGICAGGYYGSNRIEFEVGTKLEVKGPRELNFFPGCARGCVFPGFVYDSEKGSRASAVTVDKSLLVDVTTERLKVYYNGGCSFVLDQGAENNTKTLAWYDDEGAKGKAAIVECKVGKGTAILTGVHPEYDPKLMDAKNADSEPIIPALLADDLERIRLLRSIFRRLGLKTSERPMEPPTLTNLGITAVDEQSKDDFWQAILPALMSDLSTTSMETKDTLRFSRSPVPGTIAQDEKTAEGGHVVTAGFVSSLKDMSFHSFDSLLYFDFLRKLRSPLKESVFGSVLMYADVITSTQTILDKNVSLLQTLPTGFVCSANHQVAGRGRGSNAWVSPDGCLQFSFVMRHPGSSANTVVFVQYLIALAIVEAVRTKRGYEDLPIHLKWPNDIYVKAKDEPQLRKIGGILVNSNWWRNEFLLVVGCGVNLNNSEPTDCINDVISRRNEEVGENDEQLELIRKEELLARIMAHFEDFNETFQREGFKPFLERYYKRWLHNEQRVVLADHDNKSVVIQGITEFGYLLTKCPETNEIFELQPDGNSFDLMKGMISKKKN